MTPLNQQVIISPLFKTDFTDVIMISNEIFGFGYINNDELNKYIGSNNYIGFVARTTNSIVGFKLLQINGLKGLINTSLNEKEWFLDQYSKELPVGVIKTIGVSNKFKKRGIGNALAKIGIDFLKKKSIPIISICWEQKGGSPFMLLLEKNRFERIHKLENFWEKDSLSKKYNCNNCGAPPCTCDAYIYEFKENEHITI